MDTYRIIKRLSLGGRVPMVEIARRCGISPQGLYKTLHNRISFELMNRAIEACGYCLLIGKFDGVKVSEVKRLSHYEGD